RQRKRLARRREVWIVHEAGARNVDGLRAMAAHDEGVSAAERGEIVEEPGQDGPALYTEHRLGHARREAAEVRALSGREHHGRAVPPLLEEREDLRRARLARVDQDRVGAGRVVSLGALERLRKTPARDKRFHAGDQHELGVALAVLARLDLAAELSDVGERLELRAQERVGLREELV